MNREIVVILLTNFIVIAYGAGSLKYFETFSVIGVSTRLKRFNAVQKPIKEIKFNVLNRNFHLLLQPGTDVLSEGFNAYMVHEEVMTSYHVDQDDVFSGYVYDNPNVQVSAHKEEDLWSIQVFEENETYIIEPAHNLLNASENPKNDSMIAYRSTDLNGETFGQCGVLDDNTEKKPRHFIDQDRRMYDKFKMNNQRVKRNAGDTCLLYVVGDYDLFSQRCHFNYRVCTALLISLVHKADKIYRASYFQGTDFSIWKNIGLQIGMLVLYDTPTSTTDSNLPHFNAKGVEWTAYTKLDSFEYFMSFHPRHYCLSHLVTSYPLPSRVLGLANRQSICLTAMKGSFLKSAAISSTIDIQMGPITTYQLGLVFTHEIGHNFGSSHDPDTLECTRAEEEGGHFIMWFRAGNGLHPNHKRFSPCSLRSIGAALRYSSCFVARSLHTSFCGNGIVDEGEECDAGASGIINADLCCSKYCTLQPKAECSEMNTECCSNCRMANQGMLCSYNKGIDCKKKSFCTGESFHCPEPESLPDGTKCTEGGMCYQGHCLSFCESLSVTANVSTNVSLKACFCKASEDACKWCCFDNSNPTSPGPCKPYSDVVLKDGQPCYFGHCESGVCTNIIRNSVRDFKHFWLIDKRDVLEKMLRDNLVLVVIFLSLFIYFPAWFLLRHLDRRDKQKREIALERVLSGALSVKSSVSSKHKLNASDSGRSRECSELTRSRKSLVDARVQKKSSTNVDDLRGLYSRLFKTNIDKTILIYTSPRISVADGFEHDKTQSGVDEAGLSTQKVTRFHSHY